MFIRASRVAVFCLLLCAPIVASAQDEPEGEGVELQSATVQSQTRLRRGPSAGQPAVSVLPPNTRVRVVSPEQRGDYLRVILPGGRQGYVRARDVRFDATAAAAAATATTACAGDLGGCEAVGCAKPNSTQAIFNSAKRRIPPGTASRLLTFADVRSLQTQTDRVVDQGTQLSQAERNSLRGFNVSGGTVGEGNLVRIAGFIAQGLDPHPNSGESVNCRLRGLANNDIHISLAPRVTNTEFQGIVVEMVPQDRPDGWTVAKLVAAKQRRLLVMAVGGLFYDNMHVVNSDASDPLSGQPKRFSLWEVHPITRFFVCERANNACSPNNLSQWRKLEDFQP
jgi:hypothetical protein